MLEKEITLNEVNKVVNNLPNNKRAGPDGFSAENYKKSWVILAPVFLCIINLSFSQLNKRPSPPNPNKIEWPYMLTTLKRFWFGDKFIQWINILYANPKALVLTNLTFSASFPLYRGTCQGCPLSPIYLH